MTKDDLISRQPKRTEERTETHSCDLISRQAAIEAIENTDWYHLRNNGVMMHGANSKEHQAWYKEQDVYKALERVPSVQPEIVRCKDCKHQVKEWRTDKRLKDKGYMVCGCEVVGDACGYWALLGQDDDYCSFAERRTDE